MKKAPAAAGKTDRVGSPPDIVSAGAWISTSRNAAENLAMEEALLARIPPGREVLFLYENDPAVVIGRFQNPWRECRTGLARRLGIPVRRRISGGGTVVHAPGNLNFAVISGRREPDKEGNLDRVIRALAPLGVALSRNDRLDLQILPKAASDGLRRKVSGSAFRQTSSASMHHATLLVAADLAMLSALLKQPERDMEARGVASRPSPVANIAAGLSGVGTPEVARALAGEWGEPDGPRRLGPADFVADPVYIEARRRLETPEWTWGRCPAFRERFADLTGYSRGTLEVEVVEGRVEAAGEGAGFLVGSAYHGPDLLAAGGGAPPPWLKELADRVDGDG